MLKNGYRLGTHIVPFCPGAFWHLTQELDKAVLLSSCRKFSHGEMYSKFEDEFIDGATQKHHNNMSYTLVSSCSPLPSCRVRQNVTEINGLKEWNCKPENGGLNEGRAGRAGAAGRRASSEQSGCKAGESSLLGNQVPPLLWELSIEERGTLPLKIS